MERGDTACLVPQNLYEFWTVATRPVRENGLGFSAAQADAELSRLQRIFEPLSPQETPWADHPELLKTWRTLVLENDVKGKVAHDARLVATMTLFSVAQILTFNKGDFVRFRGVSRRRTFSGPRIKAFRQKGAVR